MTNLDKSLAVYATVFIFLQHKLITEMSAVHINDF